MHWKPPQEIERQSPIRKCTIFNWKPVCNKDTRRRRENRLSGDSSISLNFGFQSLRHLRFLTKNVFRFWHLYYYWNIILEITRLTWALAFCFLVYFHSVKIFWFNPVECKSIFNKSISILTLFSTCACLKGFRFNWLFYKLKKTHQTI